MHDKTWRELTAWIAAAGLKGKRETELLAGFCTRVVAAGLPLSRAVVGVDTLHPVLGGRIVQWSRATGEVKQSDYGRSADEAGSERWQRSPFYYLIHTGDAMLRRRLPDPAAMAEFPVLDDVTKEGGTDYVAMVSRFGEAGTIGEVDCVFSSWASDRPGGFSDGDLAALEFLVRLLALAIKGVSITRIADNLVTTYLGRDAGRRVLRGHIARGVAEKITTVLWFSDLHSFTRMSDTAAPEQIIPFLNDYSGALVEAIHAQQGDVLKFIGDGILAIFNGGDPAATCKHALAAAVDGRRRVSELNARREASGLPVTRFYLGLHVGEAFYGNIGSTDRLDFTVVGPAVNEASRIAAMCRSLDQDVLLSSAFADAGRDCGGLVSVGRYALRGVSRPQELYTLDPEQGAALAQA